MVKKDFRRGAIRLTTVCNQKCIFCGAPLEKWGVKSIIPKELSAELKRRIKREDKRVTFSGGEPTLHPKIESFIKEAVKNGLKVSLQTNGVGFSGKDLKKWEKAGLDRINLAFPSHLEKVSNELRGVNFGFEESVANLIFADRLGIDVNIIHVMNSLNYKLLPRFVDFIRALELKNTRISFTFISPLNRAWENKKLIPKMSNLKKYLLKAAKQCEKYKLPFDFSDIVSLCVIPGYEDHAISTIFRANLIAKDENNLKEFLAPDDTAVKLGPCKRCTLNPICAGLYERVADLYGLAEFQPSKTELKKKITEIVAKRNLN